MSSKPSIQSVLQAEPTLGPVRTRLLSLYATTYFYGIRMSRGWLPGGKVLMGLAAACFLMAWDPSREAMRYGFAFCVTALIVAAAGNRLRQPRSLRISRELPDRAVEGSLFDYTLVVTNSGHKESPRLSCRDHGRLRFPKARDWTRNIPPFQNELNAFDRWMGYPKWLWLIESLQDVVGSDVAIPSLKPGQTVRISCQGRAGRRGRRLFMGLYCGLPDPMGLLQRVFYVPLRQTLLVLPKPLHSGITVPVGSRSLSAGDARDLRKSGDSEEFRSLREWRSGDPLKRIDWKATARAQSPVAREYAPEYKLRTALAFDTGLPAGVDEEAFEIAMGHAAGLAVSIDRKDRNIDLLMVEQHVISLRLGQGAQDHILALERLADSAPSNPSSLKLLETSISSGASGFSSVVMVCPAWTLMHAAMAERLASRGIGLAIVVCSSHIDGAFPPGAAVRLVAGAMS